MATCFGLSLDHFQADVLRCVVNQCALCNVGSHVIYKVYKKLIKDIKVYVNVKILLVRM